MITNPRTYINHLLTMSMVLAMGLTACSDDLVTALPNHTGNGDETSREPIMFSAGTTENYVTTRADGKTYYMPDAYRFVCRMYYKPMQNSDEYDITHGTDQLAWLQVEGQEGNSLYRTKNYRIPTESQRDEYHNDKTAPTFYWQNRREHAFLAWTDLNKAGRANYIGGTQAGTLKFDPDVTYEYHTGVKSEQWVTKGFEIYGVNEGDEAKEFATIDEVYDYAMSHDLPAQNVAGVDVSKAYFNPYKNWDKGNYMRQSSSFASRNEVTGISGWYICQLYLTKKEYTPLESDYEDSFYTLPYLRNSEGHLVARIETEPNNAPDAEPTLFYWACDEDGFGLYDESSAVTFLYQMLEKKEEIEQVEEYPALEFDISRHKGTFNSIADQPDICQALTFKAPANASDNRVHLYFKHQFSQLQVNLKSAQDNSVQIKANQIMDVQLLGVSNKGYIFLDLENDPDVPTYKAKVRPSSYEPVDLTKIDDDVLDVNPYGTSFEMFDMYDPTQDNDGYATGYLRSFNAITFGQLQAIRVRWTENEDYPDMPAGDDIQTPVIHEATFRIPDTNLINLQSGIRYIWNMELRRGTLAVIRTIIEDWIVPPTELEYKDIDGVIDEGQQDNDTNY